MKKKIIGSMIVVFSVFILSGCGEKEAKVDDSKAVKETVSAKTGAEGICGIFTKESVASITGLDIVSTDIKSSEGSENSNCRYFISKKRYAPVISIGQYKGNAELEKKKYTDEKSFKGWKTGNDKRITTEHFIAYNDGGQMSDIFLLTGKNEYYRISLYSLNIVKDEQMIELASKVAQKASEKK